MRSAPQIDHISAQHVLQPDAGAGLRAARELGERPLGVRAAQRAAEQRHGPHQPELESRQQQRQAERRSARLEQRADGLRGRRREEEGWLLHEARERAEARLPRRRELEQPQVVPDEAVLRHHLRQQRGQEVLRAAALRAECRPRAQHASGRDALQRERGEEEDGDGVDGLAPLLEHATSLGLHLHRLDPAERVARGRGDRLRARARAAPRVRLAAVCVLRRRIVSARARPGERVQPLHERHDEVPREAQAEQRERREREQRDERAARRHRPQQRQSHRQRRQPGLHGGHAANQRALGEAEGALGERRQGGVPVRAQAPAQRERVHQRHGERGEHRRLQPNGRERHNIQQPRPGRPRGEPGRRAAEVVLVRGQQRAQGGRERAERQHPLHDRQRDPRHVPRHAERAARHWHRAPVRGH